MALTQISTAGVKDDAVTSGKIPANAVGSSELADNAVTAGKLASGVTDLSNDTSPQLGGDLASNGNDIDFADNDKAVFGTGSDLQIYHDGTNSVIGDVGTGALVLKSNQIDFIDSTSTEFLARFFENSAVELYFDSGKKFETTGDGVNIVDNVLKFQGQGNRKIIYRPGDNDMIYEFDSGDFYRQDIGNNRHEFFVGNSKKVSVTGDGLTFNADTAAANALDDYEEGTWVPAFRPFNNSSNSTCTIYDANYTKVGRKVTFNTHIKLDAHPSGTTGGVAIIIGLPFASMGEHASCVVSYWTGFAAAQMYLTATVQPSSTYLMFRHTTAVTTGPIASMDYDNNLQANSALIVSGTYFAA